MRRMLGITALAALVAVPATAYEIEEATTASQEVKLELENTVRVGSVPTGEARSEHEVAVTYGALKYWTVGLGFELENTSGSGSSGLNQISWISKIGLLGGEGGPSAVDLALYTEVELDLDDTDERTLVIGPAVGFSFDPVSVGVNAFQTIPLGNGPNDLGFSYGVGAMFEVSPGLEVGVEAHGEIPAIYNNITPVEEQEHVVGPRVIYEFEPEEGREVGVSLGSFFGLTNASPDLGVSANLELGF